MYTRGSGIFLALLLLTGCVGTESGSSLGLAEQSAREGSLAQLINNTNGSPRLGQACFTLPRGMMSRGPGAKYCVNTPNGFQCMAECRRER